jgi:hypothetical protein
MVEVVQERDEGVGQHATIDVAVLVEMPLELGLQALCTELMRSHGSPSFGRRNRPCSTVARTAGSDIPPPGVGEPAHIGPANGPRVDTFRTKVGCRDRG